MNVHCTQQGLLKPCPERLVHRPFGQGLTSLHRTKTASPQLCKHTVCQVATKLPADQVKHHPGAVDTAPSLDCSEQRSSGHKLSN